MLMFRILTVFRIRKWVRMNYLSPIVKRVAVKKKCIGNGYKQIHQQQQKPCVQSDAGNNSCILFWCHRLSLYHIEIIYAKIVVYFELKNP